MMSNNIMTVNSKVAIQRKVVMTVGSKVETISRLAQWRIHNFEPCTCLQSEPFRIGNWNWQLSVENCNLYICQLSKQQPLVSKLILRVTTTGNNRRIISPIHERLLLTSDFLFHIDNSFRGRLTIDVEFLDLQVNIVKGEEASSIWKNGDRMLKSSASKSMHRCLSRMFHELIGADVTINTIDGTLKAHKAILSASSPVFHSMFLHDLKEKTSSIIDIQDMSFESCITLVSYFYGTIRQDDFWKHRSALLVAADKYEIIDLKVLCEDSFLDDINTGNVLARLQEAWLYQLDRLKKGCLSYLFDFGKINDIRDEVNEFLKSADRELIQEVFQEMLSLWKVESGLDFLV